MEREQQNSEIEDQERLISGEIVRVARRGLQMNQTELGKRWAEAEGRFLPYSQAWVSTVEGDKQKLYPYQVKRLFQVLGISEDFTLSEVQQAVMSSRRLKLRQALRPENSFGITDQVTLTRVKTGLQLDFAASEQAYHHSILLTKFPIALGGAVVTALNNKIGTFEYAGENFGGRVLLLEGEPRPLILVAEFSTPKPHGFLIQMERDELATLKNELIKLPLHDLQTD